MGSPQVRYDWTTFTFTQNSRQEPCCFCLVNFYSSQGSTFNATEGDHSKIWLDSLFRENDSLDSTYSGFAASVTDSKEEVSMPSVLFIVTKTKVCTFDNQGKLSMFERYRFNMQNKYKIVWVNIRYKLMSLKIKSICSPRPYLQLQGPSNMTPQCIYIWPD